MFAQLMFLCYLSPVERQSTLDVYVVVVVVVLYVL